MDPAKIANIYQNIYQNSRVLQHLRTYNCAQRVRGEYLLEDTFQHKRI